MESQKQKTNQGERQGGINWEIRVDIDTQLYIKQIISKDLLYSAGNSTQSSVTTYMAKDSKKGWVYVYI